MRIDATILAVLVLLGATQVHAEGPAYNEPAAKERCETEWPGNFQMTKFCLDQDAAGYREFTALRQSLDADLFVQSVDECVAEWPANFQMANFCAQERIKSLLSIEALQEDVPEAVGTEILGKCYADWGLNFQMVAFCMEQQVTAWKELQE
ncbi:hypothetical protein [Tropicimonas marinistellae]|uniref:hypothetical protein n=1 Tax=Tropicimonas marinistellae TaxID=1739787 RepID=UPI000836951E|nr:hypothetical protein [Tropicimonas marinistellae]